MISRRVIPFPLRRTRVHKRTLRSDLQLLGAWSSQHTGAGWLLFLIVSALLAVVVGIHSEVLAAATIQRCTS